jgi:hypothetical protein
VDAKNVNDKECERDDGIVDAVFEKRVVQCCDEREAKPVHYVTGDMKGNDETAAGKPDDEIREEINVVEVFGVQKEVRHPIAGGQRARNKPEQ